jgi:hypothetical protein
MELVFIEWQQLALDKDHEVWFTGSECGCGFSIWRASVVGLVYDEA